MTLEETVSRYIESAEYVFKNLLVSNVVQNPLINKEKIVEVIEYAKNYLKDAKYYKNKSKLETGLASISYCEGLLDALRLLEFVKFSWSRGNVSDE